MKSKTIIALWGNSGQGKSTAIRAVANEIQIQFPKAIIENLIVNRVDIKMIIRIGQIIIGIESQGDPGSRMPVSLKDFKKEECDIIICATRTSGNTVKAVDAMAGAYDIIWVSNHISYEKPKAILNELFAKHILTLIKQFHRL